MIEEVARPPSLRLMMAAMSAASAGQDVARRLMDDGYVVVTGMLTAGRSAGRAR